MGVVRTILAAALLLLTTLPVASQTISQEDTARKESIPVVSGTTPDSTIVTLTGINSSDRDDSPLVTADGRQLFFNSTRLGERPWARRNRNRYDDDIYVATSDDENPSGQGWGLPRNMTSINTSEDDGVAAISPSGNLLYFLSMKRGWDALGGPFFEARRDGRIISDIKGLGGGITKFFKSARSLAEVRIFGASMSADQTTFYFATTLNSSTNDHEIWLSHRDSTQAEWGYPMNLGPAVNAGGGSYAPFIAADGRTLYFSSGRPGGLGGDDIYMSVLVDGRWRDPVNLRAPINSPADDSFLSLPASADKAYFSSSRSGSGDIFMAALAEELRPANVLLLSGLVESGTDGHPLEADVIMQDFATGATVFRGPSGSADGRFAAVLRPGHEYRISVSAPGYVFQADRFVVPADIAFQEIKRTYRLVRPEPGLSVTLENLFFDLRSSILRPESYLELDQLAEFLKENPGLMIEIGGHTDSTGSPEFNVRLSVERADAVKQYLVSARSIEQERLETRGYGDTKPVATNDTEEGRRRNRRVEFTILPPSNRTIR